MTDFETSDRDVTRAIRSWLDEDRHEDASRIAGAVLDRAEATPQRRAGWPAWRTPIMSKFVTYGLGAAVVVVIGLFLGYQLLGAPRSVGGPGDATPTPQPTPTATATATPSPAANLPSWYTTSESPTGSGILSAGSYETDSFKPGFAFSVPTGWVNDTDSPGYFGLFPDTPANQAQFARSESLAQNIFMGFNSSPYWTCQSAEHNSGATAAELVAAMAANDVLAVSNAVDVAIGGLTGKQVDVSRNPDWTGTCPEDSDLPAGVDPQDERVRAVLLDVPGRGVLLIFLYSATSADNESFLAEAMPIVESFQFSQ